MLYVVLYFSIIKYVISGNTSHDNESMMPPPPIMFRGYTAPTSRKQGISTFQVPSLPQQKGTNLSLQVRYMVPKAEW